MGIQGVSEGSRGGGEGGMKLSRSIGWAEKESFLKGVVEGKRPGDL